MEPEAGGAALVRETPEQKDDSMFLVPLHADNWALALAAGYIGGQVKDDAAVDFQTGAGSVVRGFIDAVPREALELGEAGPRVVVAFPANPLDLQTDGGVTTHPAPLRITSANRTYFRSLEELLNFKASYGAFPDVPIDLLPMEHSGLQLTDAPVANRCEPEQRGELEGKHALLNRAGGWAAAAMHLLAMGKDDEALKKHFAQGCENEALLAESALLAFDPTANEIDVQVWQATVLAVLGASVSQGFDRLSVLENIAKLLPPSAEGEAWIQGCRRIFDAEVDAPKLDDSRNVGRRAALALMLAHDPAAVEELEHSFGAGEHVRALVSLAAFAFTGLARLPRQFKGDLRQFNCLLEMAECIEAGRPARIAIDGSRLGQDLSTSAVVTVNGVPAFERRVDAAPHLLMLKARAQEAGFRVDVDDPAGLTILSKGGKGPIIRVQDDPDSSPQQPVARLTVELGQLGVRPTTDTLRRFLMAAWAHSCAIGICEQDEKQIVCGFASLPLATLDRDEFLHHVQRLTALAQKFGTKAARQPRPSKRAKAIGDQKKGETREGEKGLFDQ